MKNLARPLREAGPVPADVGDGVLAGAASHLTAVKFPNRLDDIAVVGRLRDWHRSFLLRPKYGGRFALLVYPRNRVDPESIIVREFDAASFNSAPVLIDVSIPPDWRLFDTWHWRVVKIGVSNDSENHFARFDALEVADGMLDSTGGAAFAQRALEEKSYSTLVFQIRPVMSGEVVFEEESSAGRAKLAAWSCHQPYATEDGLTTIKSYSEPLLAWYRRKIERFSPHRIWMLGDSVYSDAIGSLDFVRQVYDRTGWQNNDAMRKDLLSLYRLNYRYHWGFAPMQGVMRRFPHLGMWDDHEIRDGFGSSEADFRECNQAIKRIATQAAEEYLFQYSPKLRSESTRNSAVDKHQAYVDHTVAAFIFDGRNSRNYGEDMPVPSEVPVLASALAGLLTGGLVGALAGGAAGIALSAEIVDVYRWHNPGELVSDLQLQDFAEFCRYVKRQSDVAYVVLGNGVPFIYILDFVESIAAEAALAAAPGVEIRDDIRDSWHSPANRRQLAKLLDILKDLHQARPDLEIVNVSGDIHLSNAFEFQPDGFSRPLFQVTSSALTNAHPDAQGLLSLLSAGGPLSCNAKSPLFGPIRRLWHVGTKQNFLTIDATVQSMELHLHTFDRTDPASQVDDKVLTVRPMAGFVLADANGAELVPGG